MSNNYAKQKPIVTPVGIAIYPRLHKPDTKFKKEGEYSTKLKFSPNDEAALIEKLQVIYDEGYAEACRSEKKKALKKTDVPWRPETDSDGAETGNTVFNFKMKASGVNKEGKPWTQQPSIFDSHGVSLAGDTALNIGGGSKLKVSFFAQPFYTALGYGLTLKLKAVQIIDYVPFGGGSASSYGFGAEEEGYVSRQDHSKQQGDDNDDSDAKAAVDGGSDEDEF